MGYALRSADYPAGTSLELLPGWGRGSSFATLTHDGDGFRLLSGQYLFFYSTLSPDVIARIEVDSEYIFGSNEGATHTGTGLGLALRCEGGTSNQEGIRVIWSGNVVTLIASNAAGSTLRMATIPLDLGATEPRQVAMPGMRYSITARLVGDSLDVWVHVPWRINPYALLGFDVSGTPAWTSHGFRRGSNGGVSNQIIDTWEIIDTLDFVEPPTDAERTTHYLLETATAPVGPIPTSAPTWWLETSPASVPSVSSGRITLTSARRLAIDCGTPDGTVIMKAIWPTSSFGLNLGPVLVLRAGGFTNFGGVTVAPSPSSTSALTVTVSGPTGTVVRTHTLTLPAALTSGLTVELAATTRGDLLDLIFRQGVVELEWTDLDISGSNQSGFHGFRKTSNTNGPGGHHLLWWEWLGVPEPVEPVAVTVRRLRLAQRADVLRMGPAGQALGSGMRLAGGGYY